LTDVHIAGYRSIRSIRFPVRRLSVLIGGNGVGKTNLYRALELVHAAALGTLAEEIGREGGMPSVFWAGERKRDESQRIALEVALDGVLHDDTDRAFRPVYRIEIGFPNRISDAAFDYEGQIKAETLTITDRGRKVTLLERKGPTAWARAADGRRIS